MSATQGRTEHVQPEDGRGPAGQRGALLLLWGLSVAGLVVYLGGRRAALEPLVRYGFSGAEYLELLQLGYARALLRGDAGWAMVGRITDYLVLLDGEYPPGLHILAAGWERVTGALGRGEPLLFARELNIAWSLVLALATASLTRRLTEVRSETPPPLSTLGFLPGLLAGTGVLLAPGILGAGHRYYYDLPMTAMSTLALAALCSSSRLAGLWAGGATGLALLLKWQSGLYLLPAWASSLLLTGMSRSLGKGARVTAQLLGALACLCLISPLVRRGDWSALSEGRVPWSTETSLGMAAVQARAVQARSVDWNLVTVCQALLGPLGLIGWGSLMLCGLGSGGTAGAARLHRFTLAVLSGTLLGAAAWLGLGGARLPDERYCLPLVPLAAALVTAWSLRGFGGGDARVRAAGKGVHLLRWVAVRLGVVGALCAWVVQILEFEGLVGLPVPLRSSPSFELRGWSPLGAAPNACPDAYLLAVGAVCDGYAQRGRVALTSDPELDALHAWRWALLKECPEVRVEVNAVLEEGERAVGARRLMSQPEWITLP